MVTRILQNKGVRVYPFMIVLMVDLRHNKMISFILCLENLKPIVGLTEGKKSFPYIVGRVISEELKTCIEDNIVGRERG
jgi:hypothetical protein